MSGTPVDWHERVQGVLFRLVGRLPIDWASQLGQILTRRNVCRNRPEIIENARQNLRFHFPEASAEAIEAKVEEFLDGVGRVMGEFTVMNRLMPEGRLEATGLEAFKAVAQTRPILALGLHTGNWETFGPMFQHAGIPLTSFYAPPENAFERRIAEETRARFGVALLSPDAAGTRQAMRLLKRNQVVMIFPDEARGGVQMGPLFGRPPHPYGNLAIAVRLARHTGAAFVICHSRRLKGCRFTLDFGTPFDLPEQGQSDVLADVAFLNSKIEPIVRDNLPRWYFLDDRLDPVSSRGG
ncbi:MAG: hypothetical protein LCH38_14475 [Proteobacteria bacterium]|nr:hypothetical protein [Pseudomonadota bacterium]